MINAASGGVARLVAGSPVCSVGLVLIGFELVRQHWHWLGVSAVLLGCVLGLVQWIVDRLLPTDSAHRLSWWRLMKTHHTTTP